MRRKKFIEYLKGHKCVLHREGARHSVYLNQISGKISTVPRHTEIDDFLAKKICKDLGVEIIKKKS